MSLGDNWWDRTHGKPPRKVLDGAFDWRPVPGFPNLWECPECDPFDWSLERKVDVVVVDWSPIGPSGALVLESEEEAIRAIENVLKQMAERLTEAGKEYG